MIKSTIGIIGVGFVGDALLHSFLQFDDLTIKAYDKYKEFGILKETLNSQKVFKFGTFTDTLDSRIIFLCLPTLYNADVGGYDISSLNEICKSLQENNYQGTIVVKSTVEQGTCQQLSDEYNLPIIHNPEFLTARTAREDFHNQTHIVLGQTKKAQANPNHLEALKEFYSIHYPTATISECSSGESESMKSFVNSFYAMKVQIFNEFYLLCQKEGADFNKVVKLMLQNGWINPMHTSVPGPDGKLSYGGACFPKDTQVLLNHMKRAGTEHAMLEACIQERNRLRGD